MGKLMIDEITYMRGLCMLGVIGIHVGSFALINPHANVQLIGWLEIITRFTVPAFFFLSAFGLFYHTSVEEHFSYKVFLKKRVQVVFWPYIVWSCLYLLYNAYVLRELGMFFPQYLWKTLFFGTAMYHLYFMVILLWFYVLMPLWRRLVRYILKSPWWSMGVLFLVQMAFNFWSSYRAGSIHFDQPLLEYAFSMRLNYWVLHYVWIFLLGAVLAERYDRVVEWLWKYRLSMAILLLGSVFGMVGSYYYVLHIWGYTLLEAVFTVHQLSPMGLVYTGVACVYSLMGFRFMPMSPLLSTLWNELGKASYGIYLIHPFMLIILTKWMAAMGMTYTALQVIGLYMMTLAMSFLGALVLERYIPVRIRRYILGK